GCSFFPPISILWSPVVWVHLTLAGCVGPPSSATINIVLDRLGGLNPSRSWASRILLHSISVLSWLLYALWHWLARLRVLFAVASLLLILASAASMSPNSHPPRVWI
ncbi:hypothetical protein B0H13DRAFT_613869, partial [Mycena leptocephala]